MPGYDTAEFSTFAKFLADHMRATAKKHGEDWDRTNPRIALMAITSKLGEAFKHLGNDDDEAWWTEVDETGIIRPNGHLVAMIDALLPLMVLVTKEPDWAEAFAATVRYHEVYGWRDNPEPQNEVA